MPSDLESFWTLHTCGELVINQTPVLIDSKLSVEDACDLLSGHNISSAPVYDYEKKLYVGMFDYGDIVAFLLAVMGKEEVPQYETNLRDILQKGLRMGPVPVHMVSDLSLRNPFVYVAPETPLLEAIQFFAQGLHRIAVINSDFSLRGILSQSGVLNYVVEQMNRLGDLKSKTLEDLQLTRKSHILAVNKSDSVLNGMILMHKNGVSSMAIIDQQSKMVGTLSLSDIKFVVKKRLFSVLWKNCHDFINYLRGQQSIEVHGGKDFLPVFSVSPTSTLEFTIRKLASIDAHRLWVLDREDHPISVVTLTDIYHLLNPTLKEASYIG